MGLDRRHLIKTGAIGLLSFKLGGCDVALSPKEARQKPVPYQTLSAAQAAALDRLGDVLLPGAAAAGFTNFIDQQISGDPAEMMAFLKYMDWPPPYAQFYKAGIAALNAESERQFGQGFANIKEAEAVDLVRNISGSMPENWQGPPAPLFYFVTRNDAVDVFYGTMAGFEKLDMPYLPHIEPETNW